MNRRIATVSLLLLAGTSAGAEARLLRSEAQLLQRAPAEALEGPGAWEREGCIIATGQSICVDALGEAKGRCTEEEIAEENARLRIIRFMAAAQDAAFDPDAYALEGDVKGLRIAALYKLEPYDGVFLVALAKKEDVRVRAVYSPELAGRHSRALFDARDWKGAAKAFAALTAHGVGDADTIAWARAASAQVNLEAGIAGSARLDALRVVAEFYDQRAKWEDALKHYYALYLATDAPERSLLEKLEKLAELTRRPNNAGAFRKEIDRRWHRTETPASP